MVDSRTSNDRGGWIVEFSDSQSDLRVVIEDNGVVCYAYLLEGEDIAGDVWLYNVGADPIEVDWSMRSRMPFQNPARCCRREALGGFDRSRARCLWKDGTARVFVDDQLWAEVGKGDRPGRSFLAAVASPVALPLR